jgi:hypothetical protein
VGWSLLRAVGRRNTLNYPNTLTFLFSSPHRAPNSHFHPASAFLWPVMAAATISSSPRDHSSPLESIGTFSSQFARTLVEDYAQNELASDLTSKILFAFLDHLPPDGLCNVCEDIIQARDDLRGLADHYASNILVPSMFPLAF